MSVRYHSPVRFSTSLGTISLLLLHLAVAAQVKPVRRVLILNEVGTSYPVINSVDEGIRTALANAPYNIEFYREYMETTLFPAPADQKVIRDFYIRKYKDHQPDVIITVGSSPLRFLAETHRTSFPGVPIVFCFPNTPDPNVPLDPDFTGVGHDIAPAATVEGVLRLLPQTQHLVVLGGVSAYDRQQQAIIRAKLSPFRDRLDISYLTDLTIPDLLERLKHLPSHTAILLSAFGRDSAGGSHNANELAPGIVSAANSPVFSLVDTYLFHGEVGGDLSSTLQDGRTAGNLAVQILNGVKPENIPVRASVTTYMFDSTAMRRWGLREKDLPAGSIVLNRQLSMWEGYKPYVIGGLLVLLAQSLAIFGLLWQRLQRMKAEAQLRRSEEQFSKSFRQSPLIVTITSSVNEQFIDVNETFELQTGWSRTEVLGRTPNEIALWVDPAQRSVFHDQLLADGRIRNFEVKFHRKDGQIWTAMVSAELIDINREQCVLSVIADISERKAAEDALSTLNHRLIEAHEEERRRIARELHDDIGQRIVIIGVDLERAKRDIGAARSKAINRIDQVCRSVADLIGDVQAMSHRLHSSKLEYFGLEAASASFCRELSEQKHVKINFHADGVPGTLSNEVSLCLYRVLQESLQNAIKHSGVHEFDVLLTGTSREIRLMVRDSGKGFDLNAATRGYGLGLISMKERMKLVAGRLYIDSKPRHGTSVVASVPLQLNEDGEAVA